MAWPASLACHLQAAVVGALLAYAAYRDVRYREVDPLYWAASAFTATPLAIPCWLSLLGEPTWPVVVASNLAAVGAVGLAVHMCLMGGADLLAAAFVAYALPVASDGFPLALAVLLYSSAAEASLGLAYCLYNATLNRRLAARAPRWFPNCFLGVATTVRGAWLRPWWYPLGAPGGGGCVAEDPHEQLSRVAGEKGEEHVIWASPGHPFIAFILPGFVAAYLLGAAPIAALARVVAG